MRGDQRGASLVELVVAVGLMGLALAAVAVLTLPVLATFEAEPMAADAQQRLRGAAHALLDDVHHAGSGFLPAPEAAPGVALPALLPDIPSGGAWTVQARPHTLTTWHARRDASHGRLRDGATPGDTVLRLTRTPLCPVASATCGFLPGDDVMLFGAHGRLAIATVRRIEAPLELVLAEPLVDAWPPATFVSAITAHSYSLRPDATTGLSQLVRRLGAGPSTPVIDDVRRFDVLWIVAAGVPQLRLLPDGAEGDTTSAPAPPAPGVLADPAWPPGENCAFYRDAAGAPRWRGSNGGTAAAEVDPSVFADGPWCPSSTAAVRWDADLARVVEVRLVLGVAAAALALRPPPALGRAPRPGARLVPDLVVEAAARPGRQGGGV